jgi:hypothetical protein
MERPVESSSKIATIRRGDSLPSEFADLGTMGRLLVYGLFGPAVREDGKQHRRQQ